MGRKRKQPTEEEVCKIQFLPPCKVCDGPAARFHYGAFTCDACKIFYHRSLKVYTSFRCPTGGKCQVQYNNPKLCSKCRFGKCIAAGMDTKAIKRGRYSILKRWKDTMEVKRMQVAHPGMNMSNSLNPAGDLGRYGASQDLDFVMMKQLCGGRDTPTTPLRPLQEQTGCLPMETEDILDLYTNKEIVSSILHHAKRVHFSESFPSQRGQALAVKSRPDRESTNLLSVALENMALFMKFHIQALTNFAQSIPGFKALRKEDKVRLIYFSRFETICVSDVFNANSQPIMIICHAMSMIHASFRDRLVNMGGWLEDFDPYRTLLYVHERFVSLNLTEQELAIFCAILIMAPDREEAVSCEQVRLIYERLNECLIHLLGKRCLKPLQMYARVVSVMVELHTYFSQIDKLMMVMDEIAEPQEHPLLPRLVLGRKLKNLGICGKFSWDPSKSRSV